MEQYPAVDLMVRHGRRLSYAVGLSLPVLALLGMAVAGWSVIWLICSIPAGFAVGFVFRTFAELTQIIADMLLPK